MKYKSVIESLLMHEDQSMVAQGLELLLANAPQAAELKVWLLAMLRAKSYARNLVATKVLHHLIQMELYTSPVREVCDEVRESIFDKIGGWRKDTVQHGLKMLTTLNSPSVALWVLQRLVKRPSYIRRGHMSHRHGTRFDVFQTLDTMVYPSITLDCSSVSARMLPGQMALSNPNPLLLNRMPGLRTMYFDGESMPGWLHELSALEEVHDLRVEHSLTTPELPPGLCTLSLEGKFTSISLSIKTLKTLTLESKHLETLDLSGCASLTSLDLSNMHKLTSVTLRGCSSLQRLDIHGARVLLRLCDATFSLPALRELNISKCSMLETPWRAGWNRPELNIIADERMQEERRVPFQTPSSSDTPVQRQAALRAIDVRLRSRRDGAFRMGLTAWMKLPEHEQAPWRARVIRRSRTALQGCYKSTRADLYTEILSDQLVEAVINT